MASPLSSALASSLLDLETRRMPTSARTFTTGVKTLDQGLSPSLWTGGRLIGVISEGSPWLIEQIISEHLLSFHGRIVQDGESGNGFIIAPHSSNIVTIIHSIIAERLSHLPITNLSAASCLEKVQLLQYFDFAGLTESVAEVSARLFDMRASFKAEKTVLYLEGISVVIENSQRRIGVVQANAVLSSLLRTLVHLSRAYPSLLIILDSALKRDSKGGAVVSSAFASATEVHIGHQPGGALGQTLEGALDVTVLVHNDHGTASDGSMIVEVVKDRTGECVGQWVVWKSK